MARRPEYNPDLDKVVQDYGEIAFDEDLGKPRRYRIETRQYGNANPKLVVTNVWENIHGEERVKRINGIPLEVAIYIAKHDILKDFVEGVTSKTLGRIKQDNVAEYE
jgi:hypothetical protein